MVLQIDFSSAAITYRCKHSSKHKEAIARAVGITKYPAPLHILDATAGLGKDAFILAYHGCQVQMIERNETLICLLQDALQRGLENPEINAYVANMQLLPGEAIDIMKDMIAANSKYDVVYLDPMFTSTNKSAKAKLQMQTLRYSLQQNDNSSLLLPLAIKLATKRVVVKRHRTAHPLVDNIKPTFCIPGRTVRFDVYQMQL